MAELTWSSSRVSTYLGSRASCSIDDLLVDILAGLDGDPLVLGLSIYLSVI